jgi:UDP:flavonoid glycosyltransferase YjiC (YdhE family)
VANSKTVLLAWELGGGLGHIGPLLRLADGLAERGYRPVLAVRNLVEPWHAWSAARYPVLQAPIWQPRGTHDESSFSAGYSDILVIRGFDSPDNLLPMVQAWQALLDVVQPAFIVGSHCPTLCVAAWGTVPVVLIGFGFVLPPADQETFPLLLPRQKLLLPEIRIVQTIREVQEQRQRPCPPTLPALFQSGERFVTVLPEMDVYGSVRKEPQVGPLVPRLGDPMPGAKELEFFAYLSADCRGLNVLLAGLGKSGINGAAYIRGADADLRATLSFFGTKIRETPASLEEILPEISLVIHHGGVGLAQQALAAGRPQVIFPRHLEQMLNAQLVQQLGVGEYMAGEFFAPQVTRIVRQVAEGGGYQERARNTAASIQARGPWDPFEPIMEACCKIGQ